MMTKVRRSSGTCRPTDVCLNTDIHTDGDDLTFTAPALVQVPSSVLNQRRHQIHARSRLQMLADPTAVHVWL